MKQRRFWIDKKETKVFSKIEGLYSRRRYLKGVRKFEEYDRLSRRRNTMDRKEKRKTEGNRNRVESRSRGV